MLKFHVFILVSLLAFNVFAQETMAWNLPLDISDKNTKVKFEVDSTWHTVHGVTSDLSGKVWLADPKDFSSLRAEIIIPVGKFDTDNSSRDTRMREVMAQDKFKNVIVKVAGSEGLCQPSSLGPDNSCQGILIGSLEIRGLAREVRFPFRVSKQGEAFKVNGEFTFDWSAFGVEDPSIFIAKLAKSVKVGYEIAIAK